MIKKISLMLLIVIMLSGCSSYTGAKEIKQQMNVIEQQLAAEDWEALTVQMDRLLSSYDKNEWKLQLLGDEGEYERLHESINRLRAAIELKDMESANLELATLKTIVGDIYSL